MTFNGDCMDTLLVAIGEVTFNSDWISYWWLLGGLPLTDWTPYWWLLGGLLSTVTGSLTGGYWVGYLQQ